LFRTEPLEVRVLPAGNVSVSRVSSPEGWDLVVTGDGSANQIDIIQKSTDNYYVIGKSGTKINGVPNGSFKFTFSGITDDVLIDLGAGNDVLTMKGDGTGISDMDVDDLLRIRMGTGNDTLTLKYLDVEGDIDVDLGTGVDSMNASYCDILGDFDVTSTDSSRPLVKQRVNMTNILAGNIDIDLNYSLAVVNIVGSSADDTLRVELGSGNDRLNIKTSGSFGFLLDGGDGDDDLNFYNNQTSFSGQNFKAPTRKNISYT
jgi:hypothetical protein